MSPMSILVKILCTMSRLRSIFGHMLRGNISLILTNRIESEKFLKKKKNMETLYIVMIKTK